MNGNSNRKPKQINLKKIMIKNAEKENGGIYLVPSRWYLILLMTMLFMADFLVMYAGIEEMMYASIITCVAFATILAVVFVAGPSMIAGTLLIKNKNKIHIISALMLSFILIVMFIFWGMWRMESQATIYTTPLLTSQTDSVGSEATILENTATVPENTASMLESTVTVLENTAVHIRSAERSFQGLLVAVPVGNSILCLLITLLDATAASRAKRRVRKYAVKLQEYIEQQEAVILELEEALKQDMYKENEELYNAAVNELNAREKMVKMEARRIIAEYLETPELAVGLFKEEVADEACNPMEEEEQMNHQDSCEEYVESDNPMKEMSA